MLVWNAAVASALAGAAITVTGQAAFGGSGAAGGPIVLQTGAGDGAGANGFVGVNTGANAIPADWIKPMTAWCGIIAFIGSSVTTTISGLGMSSQSRIAAAASLPEVKAIVAQQDVATAAPSEKVVGTIQAAQAVTAKAA